MAWALAWLGFIGLVLFGFRLDLAWIWLGFALALAGFGLVSAYLGLLMFIIRWLESHIACMILYIFITLALFAFSKRLGHLNKV